MIGHHKGYKSVKTLARRNTLPVTFDQNFPACRSLSGPVCRLAVVVRTHGAEPRTRVQLQSSHHTPYGRQPLHRRLSHSRVDGRRAGGDGCHLAKVPGGGVSSRDHPSGPGSGRCHGVRVPTPSVAAGASSRPYGGSHWHPAGPVVDNRAFDHARRNQVYDVHHVPR